jgi:hypothetical protein
MVEAALVLMSVVALGELARERLRVADWPLLAAAGISAGGVAYGGSQETHIWGLAAAAFVCCALFVAVGPRPARPVGSSAPVGAARLVLMSAMFIWFAAVDFTVGLDASAHLFSYGLIALALAACALIVAHGGLPTGAAARTGLFVIAVSDIAGIVSPAPWRACDQFKCSTLGALFRGPYPSENFLALIATMTLAWTLTSMRGRARFRGVALCASTVFVTGSRTALVASALSLLAFAVTARLRRDSLASAAVRSWPIALLPTTAIAAVAIYLLDHARNATFSNRGSVWIQALQMVDGHRLVGVGQSTYHVLQQQGLLSAHFTHSEFLLLLFAGGYVGIALFVLWAAATMRALLRGAQSATAIVPLIAFVTYGLTEVTWNPLAFDSFAWIALALTVTTARAAPDAVLATRAREGRAAGARPRAAVRSAS